MQNTIRWGILGTGQIARAYALGLRDVPDAQLAAVASRSLSSAQAFAEEYSVPRAHGDYDSLAADADIDIIYIATPHSAHAENMRTCLLAGKAILCEKPFTLNHHEASEIITLAKHRRLFVMEAMWTRFLPAIQHAKHLIDTGVIGTVLQVQADFGYCATVDENHRILNPALGGGALLDVGIYPLSIAAYFLGEIVGAQAYANLAHTGVDQQTAFTLRHRNGGLSSCLCSTVAQTRTAMTISGSLGMIEIHQPFYKAQQMTVVDNGGVSQLINLPYLGNGYTHEAIEAGECLRRSSTESAIMPLNESLSQLHWMDVMRKQIGVRYPADPPGDA
jgi:predicted dehydrogenase